MWLALTTAGLFRVCVCVCVVSYLFVPHGNNKFVLPESNCEVCLIQVLHFQQQH